MPDFHLETERLIIRNWIEDDRDLFFLLNSNDKVMEFFPSKRTRAESDLKLDEVREDIKEKGYGFTAIALKQTNEAIGFCGLADETSGHKMLEDMIEIGWRLAPQFWEKGYVTEAAKRLVTFGFEDLNLPEIVSFAVHSNTRSFAVMERLGMTRDPSRDFDHPRVPDTHPHLKRHLFYHIKS